MKKWENSHIRQLTTQLKAPEKKEENSPRMSRLQEINKLQADIKNQRQRINETKRQRKNMQNNKMRKQKKT